MPDESANLWREVHELRRESVERHDANAARFGHIERAASRVEGELRIMIALLVTNGVLNVAQLYRQHG